jgi:hypothetical protein
MAPSGKISSFSGADSDESACVVMADAAGVLAAGVAPGAAPELAVAAARSTGSICSCGGGGGGGALAKVSEAPDHCQMQAPFQVGAEFVLSSCFYFLDFRYRMHWGFFKFSYFPNRYRASFASPGST